MRYAYPCRVTGDDKGGWTVTIPDVPGVNVSAPSREAALETAVDALIETFSVYMKSRRSIPAPSARTGPDPDPHAEVSICLPPVVAGKLALYTALRREGLTKVALARKLGIAESAVRKLLDLHHRSHIGQVEAALKVLGRVLVLEDRSTERP